MKQPTAKTENIIVQNLAAEVLLYDLNTNRAFCLNDTSAKVFHYCDGAHTFADLKNDYNFSEDLIYLALDELQANNLLTDEDYASPFSGMNRRQVIRRIGLASLVALPVVAALVAPTAAHAASNFCTDSQNSIRLCTCDAVGGTPLSICTASGAGACPNGCTCQRVAGGLTAGQCIITV